VSFHESGRPAFGRRDARSVARLLLVAALATGCVRAPAPATGTPAPPANGTATASGSIGTAGPAIPEPPGATLAVGGVSRHAAELGSYDYRGAGSDSPWLPARALDDVAVDPAATLAIQLEGGTAIGSWTATVAAAADEQGVVKQKLAEEPATDPKPEIRLQAPRSGSWVLMVAVRYADGSGSGTYYWQIDVR
jgi:hypothetical protein